MRAERRLQRDLALLRAVAGDQHMAQFGQPAARLAELGRTHRVGDDRADAGAPQAEFERIGRKQARQRHGDHARLVDRDVERRRVGALRQDDADPVARLHAKLDEQVGDPVGARRQCAIGCHRRRPVLPPFHQRRPVRFAIGVDVAGRHADIEPFGQVPGEGGIDRFERRGLGEHRRSPWRRET